LDTFFNTHKRYGTDAMLKFATATHAALQEVEPGPVKSQSHDDLAFATASFLELLGFYPSSVIVDGKPVPVITIDYGRDPSHTNFYVKFRYLDKRTGEEAHTKRVPVFHDKNFGRYILTAQEVIDLTKAAFPKVSVQSFAETRDGVDVYHVMVRPQFMQPARVEGAPLPTGYASSENYVVAHMQAVTRMVYDILCRVYGNEATAYAKALQTKIVYQEKYGRANWREGAESLLKAIQEGRKINGSSDGWEALKASMKRARKVDVK